MRMNITIEGKQSEMSFDDQQRTKRCLQVLKDVGFDIKIRFSDDTPQKYHKIITSHRGYIPIQEAVIVD